MSQNWSKRVTFMSHEDRDLEWCEWVSVDIKNGKGIIWVRTGVFFQSILRCLSDPQTFVKNHCARSYDFKISVRANCHREILGLFTFWSTMVLRCKTQSWLKVSKSRKKKCCRTVISHQMLKIWRAPLTSSKTVNFMSHQSNKNSAQTPGFS